MSKSTGWVTTDTERIAALKHNLAGAVRSYEAMRHSWSEEHDELLRLRRLIHRALIHLETSAASVGAARAKLQEEE